MGERYFIQVLEVDPATSKHVGRGLLGEGIDVDTKIEDSTRVTQFNPDDLTGDLNLEATKLAHHFVDVRLTNREGKMLISRGHVDAIRDGRVTIKGQPTPFSE